MLRSRADRAYSFASPRDLDALDFTISAGGICQTPHALKVSRILSRRAWRVLKFLAAVHRCKVAGWRGVQADYETLAKAIRRCTDEKCARTTLKEALKELQAAGFITRSWWSPPESEVVQIDIDRFVTLRVRVIVLTDEAIDLWTRRDRRRRKQLGRDGSRSGTSSPPAEQVDLSAAPDTHSTTRSKSDSSETLDSSTDVETNIGAAPCPVPSRATPSVVTVESAEAADKSTCSAGGDEVPLREPSRPSCEQRPVNGDSRKHRWRNRTVCANAGPSCPRPALPKRGDPVTWSHGRRAMLSTLWLYLQQFPRRQADVLYNRARWETWPGNDSPTCLHWEHWVPRWQIMSRQERFGMLRSTVVPALQRPAARPPEPPSTPPGPPAPTARPPSADGDTTWSTEKIAEEIAAFRDRVERSQTEQQPRLRSQKERY